MSVEKESKISLDEKYSVPAGTVTDEYPRFFPKSTASPHDAPCPGTITGDPDEDYNVNNWVFNHLPFRDEVQRQKFLSMLIADARIEELVDQKKGGKAKKVRKSRTSTTEKNPYHRTSIKDSSKLPS